MAVNSQGPYTYAFAITPNNSVDLANVTNAIHASSTGNVNVTFLTGGTQVLPVVVGNTYNYRVKRVNATATTAAVVGLV